MDIIITHLEQCIKKLINKIEPAVESRSDGMDKGAKLQANNLQRGCTTLMYACQNGLTSKVINEIKNKVRQCVYYRI